MESGGWERVQELEGALRKLMTAAADFLYEPDDSENQRTAEALEDALAHARTVLPDEP